MSTLKRLQHEPTEREVEAAEKAIAGTFGESADGYLYEVARDALVAVREVAIRTCTICGGPFDEDDEGPECDPTGCPGRSEVPSSVAVSEGVVNDA